MKKKLFAVLDVETAGSLGWPLVYDVAYKILDKQGREYRSRNFIIKEVFLNPELMTKAFYAKKYFTEYPMILRDPNVELVSWQEFVREFNRDMKDVTVFCAYNAAFDLRALRLTDFYERFGICDNLVLNNFLKNLLHNGHTKKAKQINNYKCRAKIPSVIYDIYLGASSTLLTTKKFREIALNNLWITPNGNISSTAQVAWRYLSKNSSFIERHTSMEDVIIETEILFRILSRKKKVRYNDVKPACIVSRFVQGKNAYFHERFGMTFTEFLWGLAQKNGFSYEEDNFFRKKQAKQTVQDPSTGITYVIPSQEKVQVFVPKNLKHRELETFSWALEREVHKDELDPNNITKCHQLRNEFYKKVGIFWSDFRVLPTNFQLLSIFNAKGIDWQFPYMKRGELAIKTDQKKMEKYLQEKAELTKETNVLGNLRSTILELSSPENEATKYVI